MSSNGSDYCDLDDPLNQANQHSYRNDEGERYHRTHNPVTDVKEDVFAEGVRTLVANTPHRNTQGTCSQPEVEYVHASPALMPSTMRPTLTVMPGPESLVVVKSVASFLSRNQHSVRNIRSAVAPERQADVPTSTDISQLPTGNVTWMLKTSVPRSKGNEVIDSRGWNDYSTKRPSDDFGSQQGA